MRPLRVGGQLGTVAEAVEAMLPIVPRKIRSIEIEFCFPEGDGIELDRADLHALLAGAIQGARSIAKMKGLTSGLCNVRLSRARSKRARGRPRSVEVAGGKAGEVSDQTAGYIDAIKKGRRV